MAPSIFRPATHSSDVGLVVVAGVTSAPAFRSIATLGDCPIGADVLLLGSRWRGRQATVWSKQRYTVRLIVEGKRLGFERDLERSIPCELIGSYSPHAIYTGRPRAA